MNNNVHPIIQLPIDDWEARIKTHTAKNLLDVATGHGGFLYQLRDWFPDGESYTGIDILPKAIEHAQPTIASDSRFHILPMDAHAMTFPEESFDVVAISNSLHHLLDPAIVLSEMHRVLRRNGLLLVFEMFCDEQTETQLTHVLFHRWWAKIDSRVGIPHFPTYPKQNILAMFEPLPYSELLVTELADFVLDAHDPATKERFSSSVPMYLERAKTLPEFSELEQESNELLGRLEKIGVHPATQLLAAQKKL